MSPPPGRPSWASHDGLPLLYLGWGTRNFAQSPLAVHYNRGTNYYVLLRGEIVLRVGESSEVVRGPMAIMLAPDCAFGITQSKRASVEILVWIWERPPAAEKLRPLTEGLVKVPLRPDRIAPLIDLHARCRDEVALADECLGRTLLALRELVEVGILRASQGSPLPDENRWRLAHTWMTNNLAIHSPVPALCDYLRMSPSSLHRFFQSQIQDSPGAYFRKLKAEEAVRLIRDEGWQVKQVAYHLGYRHPNDLSRALADSKLPHIRSGR